MPPTKPKPDAKPKRRVPIETIRHRKDKRVNIPTRELRDFMADDEAKLKTKAFEGLLYARDPSLDPQLVWKGKDEQDRVPLELPVVPIYIQEKIHPQAIVEAVRAYSAKDEPAALPTLFADFNGIKFEEMVDFYHHAQNWSNRMILGDSLLVMTSLAEKEGLKGKVQTIYIDPPYGIKFGSNWQVSTRKRDVKDGKVEDLTRQPEQIRAFRDTWELGIHSYLSYLRDRLVVARELLTESGSVFVQIGDENVHLVRCLMDEILGSDNFVSLVTFKKTSSGTGDFLPGSADYLLWFAKAIERLKFRSLFFDKILGGAGATGYTRVRLPAGDIRSLTSEEIGDEAQIPAGARVFAADNLTSQSIGREKGEGAASWFPVTIFGREHRPSIKVRWKTNETGMTRLIVADRVLVSGQDNLAYCRYLDDFAAAPISNVWTDTLGQNQFAGEKAYVVQTANRVVERCLLMTTDPGDLVLDPTCGSGTTAYVAEQWGRRWITVDTSRVALALARTRLMAARFPFYLLADTPEGIRKEAEVAGVLPPAIPPRTEGDVKKGFVYRRVPHVTLKSIANNEEIDTIWEKSRKEMEPLRTRLNAGAKSSWEEWQIPREADSAWSADAKAAHASWWKLKRERQKEIDASIAKRAAPETLFDQPYEDPKRVRVTGPFTVESLSPHRVLDAEAELPASERAGRSMPGAADFTTMILDNLRKAGVQNTRRAERLVFERLDPWPGAWIQAAGEFKDKGGATRRVAVSIGPEHGTVGQDQVKEAAKEAIQGSGFDFLIVTGFAFDAAAGETAAEFMPKDTGDPQRRYAVAYSTKQYGKLPVLLARANPDLTMGDEVLKKTGAGNLFTVFGEPDLRIEKTKDGRVEVEVLGVDVYDPTTGAIRSDTVDHIACWFIDTDYNGESFFVRHAYFTGAEEPYDKLKRALRAEVDEGAWSALYRTKSLPFDPPATGKIAVKVINHYGDEVLKVYPLESG
jgi:adenine-specific DNA-methyltransferase